MAAQLIIGFTGVLVDGRRCCGLRHGSPHMAKRCATRQNARYPKAPLSHVAAVLRDHRFVPVEFRGDAAWIEIDGHLLPANSAAALQLRPGMCPQETMVKQYTKVEQWLGGAK